MSDKLDRFTKRARRVLVLAQEEAIRLNHPYIGTEHLLLGLAREESGLALQALHALGVEPGRLIRAIERAVGRGERLLSPRPKPALSPSAKRAIELAVDEARLMERAYIGTEHLLLGVLREGESIAVRVLSALGIDLDPTRIEVLQKLFTMKSKASELQAAQWEQLDSLVSDLTEAASADRLDPLIGRQAELERLFQVLCRRTKHNPLLIGEPGVGKRTLIRGLAQRIIEGNVPEPLQHRRLLRLEVSSHSSSGLDFGWLEGQLHSLLEICAATNALLFIDQLHTWVTTAGTFPVSAALLRQEVSRGRVQIIGATTPDSYRRFIGPDAEREWALQPLLIHEPSPDETLEILRALKARYEAHHRLPISDEALRAAVALAARYVPERVLPEKALDLLDEAGSRRNVERAAAGSESDAPPQVTPADIAAVVAQWTGLPVSQIMAEGISGSEDEPPVELSP